MGKMPKIVLLLLLSLIVIGVGFFIGHRIGREYGAQQYTKELWAVDEMQLSSNKITTKINAYRERNELKPFRATTGLCRLARFRAEERTRKFGERWDQKTQSYEDIENSDTLHEADLTEEKINELCPECIPETLLGNVYISLRPEPCLNLENKKVCIGDEKFGVVENYTDRVVNGWIDSPEHNEVLLSPLKFGCVGVYGGTVILQVGDVTAND